jgi:hypothetical protein
VNQQPVGPEGRRGQGHAETARLRLGYRSPEFAGFSGYAELEAGQSIDDETFDGVVDGDPSEGGIARPDSAEINQAYAQFERCDIQSPSDELYEQLAGCATDKRQAADLRRAMEEEPVDGLIDEPRVLDVLARFPSARPSPADIVASLDNLQPRLYSIATARLEGSPSGPPRIGRIGSPGNPAAQQSETGAPRHPGPVRPNRAIPASDSAQDPAADRAPAGLPWMDDSRPFVNG